MSIYQPQQVVTTEGIHGVDGQVMLTYLGDGRVNVRTDSNTGDLTLREKPYGAVLHMSADEYGRVTARDDLPQRVNRRNTTSIDNTAPPTHAQKIIDACEKVATMAYNPVQNRNATRQSADTQIRHLRDKRDDLLAQVKEIDAEIAAQQERP